MAANKRFSYSAGSLALLAAVAGIIFIVNFFSGLAFTRLDLTENKQYTLSDSTRKLLSELPDIVTIHAVYSSNIPSPWNLQTTEVKDLLQEYNAFGKGNIDFKIIDPLGDEEEQVRLAKLGVNPVALPVHGLDQASTIKIYASIYVAYLDKTQIIPYSFNTETMEYDLTTTIGRLIAKESTKIGFLSIDPDRKILEEFGNLKAALDKEFEVEEVNTTGGKAVDENIKVLIVANPFRLGERDLFEIDQYIMRGGQALFLTDGVRVFLRPGQFGGPMPFYAMAMNDQVDSLGKLLVHYGVKRNFDLVQDRPSQKYPIVGPIGNPYPLFPQIDMRSGQQVEHPVTQGIDYLGFTWASSLEIRTPAEGIKAISLVKTSEKSWTQAGSQFIVDPKMDPVPPLPIPGMGPASRDLAVLLSGKFPSFYEGKPAPGLEGGDTAAPAPEPGERHDRSPDTNIIVIGCSTFVSNIPPVNTAQNINFVLSAIEWMTGGQSLSDIKKRKVQARPIREMTMKDLIVVGFVAPLCAPLGIVIFGVARFAIRRGRKKKFLEGTQS